ncbi:MAG: L,D-transpeptidase family protein, partial [Hymenobacter sp.]|nr:L,D-transpeptidase family protein [Hymenobacter sp.]
MALRLFCYCVSTALAVQWCGSAPTHQGAVASLTPVSPAERRAEPLAPLIRALLDTAASGGTRAADARLQLQAGAEVRALYGREFLPAWSGSNGRGGADATAALTLLSRAAEHGLRPADYGEFRLQALRDSLTQPAPPAQRARQQARLDVFLSDAVLRFMRDLGRGRLHPYTASSREKVAGPTGQPVAVLRAALGQGTVSAAMLAGQPANREYRQLQQALARWLSRPVAPDSAAYHQAQYEQAAVNLERWRWEAFAPDSDYVLINVPAYELQVVAAGVVARRHRVVVGKPATTTPTLTSTIRYFTLAPGWHVPHSIATKEMLPRIKQ